MRMALEYCILTGFWFMLKLKELCEAKVVAGSEEDCKTRSSGLWAKKG